MKVFALGGYGKVGFPAIKLLARSDFVTEVAIVGRSPERAEKAGTEIGDKAIAVQAPAKIWARAVGRKQGRAARCSCWLTAPMWDVGGYFLTSVALVVAVRKVLRGEIREPGVKTAEKGFEPQSFFDEVIAVLPHPPPDARLIDESFEWLE